jgi:hypothetical protein
MSSSRPLDRSQHSRLKSSLPPTGTALSGLRPYVGDAAVAARIADIGCERETRGRSN